MHSAASIDASATGLGIGIRLASGEPPVGAVMKPPLSMMRSNAPRSHIRSLMMGTDAGAPRLDDDLVAVAERAHVQLARRGAALRTVGLTVDHQRARAADALTAVVVEDDRLLAVSDEALVEHVEQLEERRLVADLFDRVRLERGTTAAGPSWRQILRFRFLISCTSFSLVQRVWKSNGLVDSPPGRASTASDHR